MDAESGCGVTDCGWKTRRVMTEKQKEVLLRDGPVLIKVMRQALNRLIEEYWMNKDGDAEFIACITPSDIPEYWKEARRAAELFPHLGRR